MQAIIKFRRGTAQEWVDKNPILEDGEPGYEVDTGRYKIGDGSNRWSELQYFVDLQKIQDLISAWGGSGGGGVSGDLGAHISSPEPHPIYDDGPSLVLLYQNAKV